jgi:hypothetical protein
VAVARLAILDQQPRDGMVVDGAQHLRRLGGYDHVLVRGPDVQPRVVAERLPEMEEVVVGIDEEVRTAGALEVVEGRDRRGDQRARSESSARPADDHAEPIALTEALEQVGQPHHPAGNLDLERRTAQLLCRMHARAPSTRLGR